MFTLLGLNLGSIRSSSGLYNVWFNFESLQNNLFFLNLWYILTLGLTEIEPVNLPSYKVKLLRYQAYTIIKGLTCLI